jgi:tetratricopeptide (TPR) repeat protein
VLFLILVVEQPTASPVVSLDAKAPTRAILPRDVADSPVIAKRNRSSHGIGKPRPGDEAFREIDAQLKSCVDPPERANLILRKAALYGVLERFDDAREQLDAALKEAPEDPFTRIQFDFIAGNLDDDEGKSQEAYEHLTEALAKHALALIEPELRPIYENAQLRRGFNLIWLGRFQEAALILEEALSFKLNLQNRSIVLVRLGRCYTELTEWERARGYLEDAREIGLVRESEGQAHFYLGVVYAYLGLFPESKREFQICEEHAAEYGVYGFSIVEVYGWLFRVCKELGEKVEAEKYARLARPA